MSRIIKPLIVLALLLAAGQIQAADELWQEISPGARGLEADTRAYRADETALRDRLALAPHQSLGDRSHRITLPMPDGGLAEFAVVEAPIMHQALAAKYPDFRTYKVYGIDDPTASGRLSLTSLGFHAMLRTSRGRMFIDPDGTDTYIARQRRSQGGAAMACGVDEFDQAQRPLASPAGPAAARVPGMLLRYRLAVAATAEYVTALGGTVGQAQAGIVVAINRVNEIFERDLGITLQLVANNDQLIESGGNVSFSNFNAPAMFAENQAWLDSIVLGSANYDVGHVFSTGGGGLAFLGAVCNNGNKAKGVTGQNLPVGDPFYIDFVAHEIGHQFNADHSFNGTTSSCGGGNRWGPTAFEPGSGSTIMGYAGICGVENIQNNSDATFHAGNITQINGFANALACGAQVATTPANNVDPVITAIPDRTIPVQTPFQLVASATDAESGANVTYQWDQMDTGDSTDAVSFGTDKGNNPLFRTYEPQADNWRDFPALGTQVQSLFDDAEVIPCNGRALDFRLTVRDGDSGQDIEDVRVTTTAMAGPFEVTNYTTAQTITVADNTATLTWDPSGTNLAPVNCASVDIDLLTFSSVGFAQYSVHNLMMTVTNDGSQLITFPDPTLSHPRARFRVKCSNNIFYDISDANLVIVGSTAVEYSDMDNTTFFNNAGTTGGVAPACGTPNIIPPSGGGNGDASSVDLLLLSLLGGLAIGVRIMRRQS